ncbi:ADP-ribose glycohydrolase ARH3-like [Venturia canescens]|uniref:ADP-ribose glycohydrolase ARH3-like n=1 Tax=Venturia canescens TaxID=32260 RepID=UPI001C9BC2E5|nr:ADP-ribose glycohydrolase ARH3-like [Venturia canescens]
MAKIELSLLRTKFRGSLLGVLTGDCLGSPYENNNLLTSGEKVVLQKFLDKLEGPVFKAPVIQYTDDSAMTRSIAQSLIEKRSLVLEDIAKKFVKNYYQEPNRGYGPSVINVFHKLRGNKFSDILTPAKEQFSGEGSLGNGGAMRVAPIALFYHNDYDQLVKATRLVTAITHTHKLGIDGAILQAIAIQQSLLSDPEEELDVIKFVDDLIGKMDIIEENDEGLDFVDPQTFKMQLVAIKNLLKEEGAHEVKIVEKLGHDVTAFGSVPTAIFCFLRAQKSIEGIRSDNPFRRAIQYAISLGGDADTIAAMTGALAGAFYGDAKLNSALLQHLEASTEFQSLADKLYEISTNK